MGHFHTEVVYYLVDEWAHPVQKVHMDVLLYSLATKYLHVQVIQIKIDSTDKIQERLISQHLHSLYKVSL